MPVLPSIIVSWSLVPYEPDGEICEGCGDPILLRGFQLYLAVGNRPARPQAFWLCQSCKDHELTNAA